MECEDSAMVLVDCSPIARMVRALKYAGYRKVRTASVELTLAELEAMAVRQTEEMAVQRQALAAREARLRYLKESQCRAGQVAAEQDRLRRLRERVEAQELKLTRLRALRGQVDHGKATNAALSSDLDSIRALFNEKEKELSLAVAKVEELTRQLEEVRRGRQSSCPPPLCQELDRLRRELLYRNKLNEQQTARLSEQREVLCQRQMEMVSIDKRIAELQERLHRKRLLNQELANQITAASNKASPSQLARGQSGQMQGKQPILRSVQSGNIAAVEPYHHVPTFVSPPVEQEFSKPPEIMKSGFGSGNEGTKPLSAPATHHYVQETKGNGGIGSEEGFGLGKADPKYQTLPYNTKFCGAKRQGADGNESNDNIEGNKTNNSSLLNNNNQINVAHSAPILPGGRKELAMALANQKHQQPSSSPTSSTSSYSSISHLSHRVYGSNLLNSSLLARGQPVGGSTTSSTSSLASGGSASSHMVATVTSQPTAVTSRLTLPPTPLISDIQKPVNTVSPTALQQFSNVYQTSSTKVHPVQPQTINPPSPQEVKEDVDKPALPPKPSVKPQPPPRQTHSSVEVKETGIPLPSGLSVLTTQKMIEQDLSASDESSKQKELVIKPRPLTIKKQPLSEIPRLRSFVSKEDEEKRSGEESVQNNNIISSRTSSDNNTNSNNNNNGTAVNNNSMNLLDRVGTTKEDERTSIDSPDRAILDDSDLSDRDSTSQIDSDPGQKKGNLKGGGEKTSLSRRVSFDPLALLLDASLEGELELVARTAGQVKDPSQANDEGITALHNAICAGHLDIVTFLVRFGCDVNAQDSDGWTPLHCAASCNNTTMVRFLVEHGACIFATTLSDHETAAEKCEEDEEGFDGCSEYLYSVQEKLGIMNGGIVYAVFDYEAHNNDELSFKEGDRLVVLRKGDEWEREWWWARLGDAEGYIPRNLLGLYPRVHPNKNQEE
ncbi:apoptosis-stimulating of p53 protein 2 isoform X3 [Halyomorpha halys]|uniref:apoptosis-stimulating of p53 protein 2 isoform X3 n=1 Tax=Halyomorpha halys TaxID=286706 RepID=UPI0034D32394